MNSRIDPGWDWSPARFSGPSLSGVSPQVQGRTGPPLIDGYIDAARSPETDVQDLLEEVPDTLMIPGPPPGLMTASGDSPVTGKRRNYINRLRYLNRTLWAVGDHRASSQSRRDAVAAMRSSFPHNRPAPECLVWAAASRPDGVTVAGCENLSDHLRTGTIEGTGYGILSAMLASGVLPWELLTGDRGRCHALISVMEQADTLAVQIACSMFMVRFDENLTEAPWEETAHRKALLVRDPATAVIPADTATPLVALTFLLGQSLTLWRAQGARKLPPMLVRAALSPLIDTLTASVA